MNFIPGNRRGQYHRTAHIVPATPALALAAGFALLQLCFNPVPDNHASAPKRVACVGNSITAGEDLARPYPERLEKLLGDRFVVYNYGCPGWPVPRPELAVELDTARTGGFFDSTWDIVISMFGTNDGRYCTEQTAYCWNGTQRFREYLSWYIDTLATLKGTPRFYHCIPAPAYWDTTFGIDPELVNDSIVPALNRFFEQRAFSIIDCHTPLADSSRLFPDGIHPNDSGAQRLAEIVHSALRADE